MAKRKQRRRRDKERRHEWEYVYVDDEGQEVDVDDEEEDAPPAKGNGKKAEKKPVTKVGRVVEPPSWRRTMRRSMIFAPLILIMVYLLRPKSATIASVVLNTLLLMAFFIPFSYFMDSIMYRAFRKRLERNRGGDAKRR